MLQHKAAACLLSCLPRQRPPSTLSHTPVSSKLTPSNTPHINPHKPKKAHTTDALGPSMLQHRPVT